MKRAYCVGLTGGIGSGKTTATDIFSELGVPIIDADAIARELVQAGQPALQEIVASFGEEIIGDDGQLRRACLRSLVFDDPAARNKLESIIHPRVYREIGERVRRVSYPYCIISSPLLLESRTLHDLDRVVVIDIPESLQLKRASRRDGTTEQEIARIAGSQMDRQQRLHAADDIIVNDRDLDYLREQVEALHRRYLHAADNRLNKCSS